MQTGRASIRVVTRISVLLLALVLLGWSGPPARAIHDLNLFQLDGNAIDEDGIVAGNPDDWNALFPIDSSPNEVAKVFVADPPTVPGADDIFTTGGSKDILDVSSWRWTGGNVPDKDDITNAYAAAYINQTATGDNKVGDLIIYFGADRFANNGDAQIGFWFFQNPVGKNPNGTFSGVHAVGDLLVLSDFTQGGGVSTIKVFKWDPTADSNLALIFTGVDCVSGGAAADDPACATVNTGNETAPWPFTPKFGTAGIFPQGSFFEGGINLTRLVPGAACFTSFLAETRSSQAVNAQLKDFALGSFNLCSIDVQKTGDTISKIGDPTNYAITITNTGAQTLYKDDIIDTVFGNIAVDGAAGALNPGVVITSNTCGASLAAGASCTISITYTIQAGAPDPLVNTVTVTYRGAPDLTGTAISDSATHSVNLFQPSVAVVKSGPALAKEGDAVTYSFTISNTSSADTPNLVLDSVTDTLLGSLTPPAGCSSLAPGASCNFTAQRTVQGADPDPLVNTVTVHYHPNGFPNDISASDDHSVNLFHPSVEVVKTGPALSKVGDQVSYNFTITNTSDSDTPSLVLDSVSDTLLGSLTATASANGCGTLAFGASCNFGVQRTVQGGDPDPLPNTVTVHYHPTGFANDISDSDDHSVNLFQPSVDVVKTGTALSKVGDQVTYDFTITNTSSTDTPNLVLDSVADTLLGDLTGEAAGAGCGTLAPGAACGFSAIRTVLGGDPDPLANTVTVHYHPTGFANDISDSDDHSVNLFQPSVEVVKTGDALSKVGDEVTYHFVITNTGSVDSPNLALDSVSDTLLGTLAAGAGQADQVPAACDSLAPGASCNFDVNYTVQAGDPDPLANAVTVHYHPAGFANDITDTDDHSVNLFQPSLTFEKTGDSLSKAGDTANWTITLHNTSSGDSPELECTITDPLLGVNKNVTLASGATDVTNVARVTQSGDPDPLVNTASVECSPVGFPNVLAASDGHSVELFQPSVTVDKTSANPFSKAGDVVRYLFTITNTSSSDSPDLTLESAADTLLGSLTAAANASGCGTLAPGASCNFFVDRTVLAGDPDPLPNTVSVRYHPAAFPNNVDASDSHSVDLLHPDYTVTKDCLTDVVPPGGTAIFRVVYTNTGDVALNITDDEPDIPDFTLAVGETRIFEVDRTAGSGPIVENTINAVATLPAEFNLANRIERAATDHCDVQGGATRTRGFWQTHIDYATHVLSEHSPDGTMDLGWKVATDIGDVMGIFWANVARESDNDRRTPVCQAQVQGSSQLAAAIFNTWLSNGAPVPNDPVTGLSLIEAMHNALRDGDRGEILRLMPLLDAYNNSGDDIAIIDVHSVVIGRADPQDARSEADLAFGDCWTAPH